MPLLLTPAAGPPDLRDRLVGLRRRWRRALVVRGLCLGIAAGVAGAAAIGLFDSALSLPAVVRAALLVGLLSAGGSFLWRGVVQPWRELGDDLALALRIEAHFPALNDAFASTVQFLDRADGDRSPGSPALRQATRRRAVRAAEGCDFDQVFERHPLRWAVAALFGAVASAVPLLLMAPDQSRVALTRLLDPFGSHPWPPRTELTIDGPDWLARGEPFVLRGRLSGIIPERVSFRFAVNRGPETEQSIAVAADNDGGAFVVRLEPNRVPKSFSYRVRANDSETDWKVVRVVVAPQLVPLDGRPSPQIHLDFPGYSDLPPRDLPDGGAAVECITGTQVHIRAATDRAVARAWIELATDPPRTAIASGLFALSSTTPVEGVSAATAGHAVYGRVPALLDSGGQRFELTVGPYVTGTYMLHFEDSSGIGGRRPLMVLLQPDPAPAVNLERPAASQDTLDVLPDASVTLAARINDPVFAVRDVVLEYRCGKDEPVQRRPLYDHDALGTGLPRLLAGAPVPGHRLRPPMVLTEQRLDLREFRHRDGRPLRDGDTLTIRVVADDFDDVSPGKPPGRSHEVELHIVGPVALQTALHKTQADVERTLQDMLKLQAAALERSSAAETQRRQSGVLRPDDADRLLQSEQLQQQVRHHLGNDHEGVRAAVDRLRRALRDNPLPRSPELDRLDALAAELDRLDREELEPIEPLLAQARQERGPVSPDARKGGALPKAIEHQHESERTLRDLIDGLKPWSNARELRAEAGALLRDQEHLAGERAELEAGQEQVGLSKDQLTPRQLEQLQRLEERQAGLAGRSNDLLEKLNQRLQALAKEQVEKETDAAGKDAQAAERERQAADGSPRGADLRREAQTLRHQADDVREAVRAIEREAQALARARQAAETPPSAPGGPQAATDQTLPGQQRDAAKQIAANRLGDAKSAQEAATAMLRNMQQSLQEQPSADADRLAKKLEAAERELNELIQDQERLQRRTEEAGQITDPGRRQQELQRLAREQERLQERARELAQRLTRQRGEPAGRDLRGAARAMDQARDQLDQGSPAEDKQDDALDRLDDAQREVAKARRELTEELQREQRAKMIDALKGIKARQESHVAESERLFQEAKQKTWTRTLLKSLNDLGHAQAEFGRKEVEPLTEKSFTNEKVIAHLLRQAGEAMAGVEGTVEKVRSGPMDQESWADDRRMVQEPQRLALRRLTQLLDALQEDEKDRRRAPGGQRDQGDPTGSGGPGGAAGDAVPPLAQLKLLRALQAEVNDQTAAFAQAHPDPTKLTPEEQAELGLLRRAQAELGSLLDAAAPELPTNPPTGDKSGDKDHQSATPELDARLNEELAPIACASASVALVLQAPERPQPDQPGKTAQPEPPKPPAQAKAANPDDDPAKLRERIAQDMQAAEKRLQANDPGPDTRQVQDRILNTIDKLLDLARNPPPPPPPSPMDNSPPPMGGQPQGGAQSQPQGGGQSRRERRDQQRRQMEQQARGGSAPTGPGGENQPQPTPGQGQMTGGQQPTGSRGQADKLADVVKDFWGHLPETLRQEVDHYYRDQFMPRYRDLLQQYYSRLAERDRKNERDR
jgi:hypothetical protein